MGADGSPRLCQTVDSVEEDATLQHHFHDGPNNTFAALRIIDDTQDLLYAEFTDVNNPLAWDFAPDQINFYELYNVSNDYFMMHNIYKTASPALKTTLHTRLHATLACKGGSECGKILGHEG